MNKIIEISTKKLIAELTEGLHHTGSTDWTIYINFEGVIDTRHNTHELTDWFAIMDLYSMGNISDKNKIYPGDDGYDYAGMAAYIVSESDGYFTPQENYNEKTGEVDDIYFNLVNP